MKALISLLAVVAFFVLFQPFSFLDSDEISAFQGECANGIEIVPTVQLYQQSRSAGFAVTELLRRERDCEIWAQNRVDYRINRSAAEVAYRFPNLDAPPKRLTNCDIFDKDNWRCEYPDRSGKVAFVKGLPAIYENHNLSGRHTFFMHGWQWRIVRFLGFVGITPIKSSWLIPDQTAGT
jgi:hypothetical protein